MYLLKDVNQNYKRRMIKLQRSAATTFIVTVTELTTIANPEYLFEFVNEQSDDDNDTQYCILADTSSATTRYNTFTITDESDVTFPIDGYYIYNIYEQANGSGNLDPDGLTLVEKGRAHVYVTDVADNEYTDTTEADKIYQNE